jgi:DNA-binding protein YbaB
LDLTRVVEDVVGVLLQPGRFLGDFVKVRVSGREELLEVTISYRIVQVLFEVGDSFRLLDAIVL